MTRMPKRIFMASSGSHEWERNIGFNFVISQTPQIVRKDGRPNCIYWLERANLPWRSPVSSQQAERAVELFSQNYNCAQSVYAACATSDGLSEAQRLALAAPFGGGIARQGEVCGALTGALLTLGEAGGEAMAADPVAGRNALYERVKQLTEAFRAAHGSILCRELTGCALDTEAGQHAFKERGLHKNLCTGLVVFAADRVASITTASA
jgi:C_GCAxxG_C_C family probable redox protein